MESTLRNNLEIIESLPASIGIFSTVSFKARETDGPRGSGLGRVVLLRLIPSKADTPELRLAADSYSKLNVFPSILAFHGLAEIRSNPSAPDGLYAVSEYSRGISLRERIKRVAPFSLAVTLDIAISITRALIAAEAQNVEHGFLIPESVLLTTEGQVKVADFEIGAAVAKALGLDAPDPDAVYCVAALMYEMLTAAPPPNDHDISLSPRSVNSGIPPAIEGIVQKASSLNPGEAYASLLLLLADLQTSREDLRTGKPLTWSPARPIPAAARIIETPQVQPARATESYSSVADDIIKEDLADTMATNAKIPDRKSRSTGRRSNADPDDEYDDEQPSRAPSVLRGILITLGLIAFAGIIFACSYIFVVINGVPSDITIPNLIGKQFTDAQKIGGDEHFALVQTGHDYSDTWPTGAIYQQDPAAGRSIKSGKEVDVFVSDGPRLSDVPDLSQMTIKKAQDVLADSGLPIGSINYVFSDTDPKDIVTAQQPAAGSKVSRDTAVNVTVSKGPAPPSAPDNLSATTTIPGEIDLSWDDVETASTYNVYRDGTKIVSALPQTTYSDINLGASDTHTYTVTSVDANGESTPSKPVVASAQPGMTGQPATTDESPADDTSSGAPAAETPINSDSSGDTPKQRAFQILFRLPQKDGRHNVQIQVQDTTGSNIVYDENQYGGDTVSDTVTGFGNKVIIRIFIDGKLVKQTTK